LSGFESELSVALERIIASRSIKDQNNRALLFNLMALMAIKSPRHRENSRRVIERIMKVMMGLATATPERWASHVQHLKAEGAIESKADTDYRKMRDFVEADRYKIEVGRAWHLELELKKSFKAVLPFFFGRKWILFRAPPNTTGFVTSDNPVCLMWSDPARRGGFRQPGHGLRGTQIVFPISHEMAIIGAFEAHDEQVDASEPLVAQINGTIILYADRQIYARDDQFPYIMEHNDKTMRGADLLDDQCLNRSAS
jgi:hypothetical protein